MIRWCAFWFTLIFVLTGCARLRVDERPDLPATVYVAVWQI